jgi:DNA-binding SARP family transcriptional activator
MVDQALHHSTVRLIGHQLRVTVDGIGHQVPAGSQRLLAFVALPRIRLERAYVAGTLWPSCDDVRAIGNLRSALWRLRCAGIAVIVSDKRSLGLASGTDVDVHHVAAWAGRLIAGRPEPDDLEVNAGRLPDADGGTALVEACALFPAWRDEWALLEHERLRQRVLHALEAVAGLLAEGGRAADAVTVATIAVAIDPLRESAQRSLIAAHLAAGDGAAATVAYSSFADRVRRELRVEPSRRLAALLPQPAAVTIRASSEDGSMPTSVPSWTR